MLHPQIIVKEADGWLAEQIRDVARENSWIVREIRDPIQCEETICSNRPTILLVVMGKKIIDDLKLVSRIYYCDPDCGIAVFGSTKYEGAAQRAGIAGLLYDVGVRYAMFPPLTKNLIEDLTYGLMSATIRRGRGHKGSSTLV